MVHGVVSDNWQPCSDEANRPFPYSSTPIPSTSFSTLSPLLPYKSYLVYQHSNFRTIVAMKTHLFSAYQHV